MQINTKQRSVCKNAYKHHFFWKNKIIEESNLLKGHFENQNITNDSKIVYTGIIDYEKNILHHGFVVYPSIYKILGFLQHVFIPTAFFTWFDRKYYGFYIPSSPYPNIVNEVIQYTNKIDLDLVESMNNSFYFINNLWLFSEPLINLGLKSFCEKFNTEWDKAPNHKLFLKIFDTPSDIFDFIKDSLGWTDYNEFIIKNFSTSLDTLKFTCNNALIGPLLNRNFIDILNTNMPILF